MLDKITIVDFEDSFTYNIANILFPFEKSLSVVSHRLFFSSGPEQILQSSDKHAVILGPGPGHPEQYRSYLKKIQNLQKAANVYLMGICLGHQLMGLGAGHKIDHTQLQMHGEAVAIHFLGKKIQVQRYNSLAVWIEGKESDIIAYEQGISYQFHPESIGTDDNILFFKELLNFIK